MDRQPAGWRARVRFLGTTNLGPNTPAETLVGESAVLADLRKRFPAARILFKNSGPCYSYPEL